MAGVLGAAGLLAPGPAAARGGKEMLLRVDLRTGAVASLPLPRATTFPPTRLPPPPRDPRRFATHREGTALVLAEDPDAAKRRILLELPAAPPGATYMPWSVLQESTLATAWREERKMPGRPSGYRDVIRTFDLETRALLWTRDDPYHDAPGAFAIGPALFALDQDHEVQLIETRTGRVLRQVAKREDEEESFAVTSPAPGRTWLEAGDVIEALDPASARPLWRLPKEGKLLSVDRLPGGDQWLVKTARHAYRIDGRDGRVVWSAPSPCWSAPALAGARAYEACLDDHRDARWATASLVERDLATGKRLREYHVLRYQQGFDQATAVAVQARAGSVDVYARFLVLD
jgi:hypothetical protein